MVARDLLDFQPTKRQFAPAHSAVEGKSDRRLIGQKQSNAARIGLRSIALEGANIRLTNLDRVTVSLVASLNRPVTERPPGSNSRAENARLLPNVASLLNKAEL